MKPVQSRIRRLTSASSVLRAFSILLLAVAGIWVMHVRAANTAPVQMDVSNAGPREIEEQTQNVIVRDYQAAWQALSRALEQNNPAALGDLWVGFAREQQAQAIAEQKQSGISVRYLDRGHKLDAMFYSPEGSALQLRDTAQLERQVLDGESVITSEKMTTQYLVVMTPTTDHWQVRILQPENLKETVLYVGPQRRGQPSNAH